MHNINIIIDALLYVNKTLLFRALVEKTIIPPKNRLLQRKIFSPEIYFL